MNVLITGANGFVGSALATHLNEKNHKVQYLIRSKTDASSTMNTVYLKDYYNVADWIEILKNIDVVVHLIARTHHKSENETETSHLYKEINVGITAALCQAILQTSVKRLIYLSSVKVNGETTSTGMPFSEDSACDPQDNYGATKLEAEQLIKNLFFHSNKEYVIVRPPLIYGQELKGNLEALKSLIRMGFPLPFGCIQNSRSLVSLSSLVNFLEICLSDDRAKNALFLVSDDKKYSTAEIAHKIAEDHGLSPRLFCIPSSIFKLLLLLVGKRAMSQKLLSNLEVDNSYAKKMLDWKPSA